jgi:arsenate reductase
LLLIFFDLINRFIAINQYISKMENLKYKVLFVCIHNSARSQMAEAFLRKYGDENFESESGGIEPGKLNANVVQVMKEKGIDISNNQTKSVFDLYRQGKAYHAVITVCDQASAERCPVFPGRAKRIPWSFPDPSSFTGTPEEVLEKTRRVRDEIEEAVLHFIRQAKDYSFWL